MVREKDLAHEIRQVRKAPTLGGLDLQSLVNAKDETIFFKGPSKKVNLLADLIDF
jgi:hypothetical protein